MDNFINPALQGLQAFQMGQQMNAQKMQMQQQQQLMQRREQMKADMAQFAQRTGKTAEDYTRFAEMYPELQEQMNASIKQLNATQKQEKVNQLMPIYAALKSGNPDAAKEQIAQLQDAFKSSGMDSEAQNLDILSQNIDLDPRAAETSAGLFLANAMGPEALQKMMSQLESAEQGGGRAQPVGGGIIIEDPNTHQKKLVTGSFQNGQLSIAGADLPGTLVSRLGETPKDVRTRTVQTTKEQEAVKQAQKRAAEYADRFDKINEGIYTLDEAATVIKAGIERGDNLGQGAIMQYLPTIKQSTMELRSIANRLGLNVVSSVTFGALSEGELKMAMSTGLPPGIKGQKLLDWVNKRRAAQQKLASYLSEASIYLGDHTVPEWMKYRKEQKKQKAEATPETNQNLKSMSTGDLFQKFQQSMGK
jgi:hypothetical protein